MVVIKAHKEYIYVNRKKSTVSISSCQTKFGPVCHKLSSLQDTNKNVGSLSDHAVFSSEARLILPILNIW